ncbi:MAG TPA: endonuclease III [Candidatus Binatia bacterium]|nr:endonuclease III [Candidatus Binatia bacterium]
MSGARTNSARLTTAAVGGLRRRKGETFQEKSARAGAIAGALAQLYSEVECPLTHRNTFELLIAVMLSAQCTDAAVNRVTPELFGRFPDAQTLSQADTSEIEPFIRTLGLFRAKAKSLQRCARRLVEEFNGEVPSTMAELTRLAGVGRKTANVMLGHAFGTPGIAVDTHCKRLARRLGLTRHQDPTKIEQDLSKLLPPSEWTGFSHRLIIHGRRVCFARKPACQKCAISRFCPSSTAADSKQYCA